MVLWMAIGVVKMEQPKRFEVRQNEIIQGYGVQFYGGRLFIQWKDLDTVLPPTPRPYKDLDHLLAVSTFQSSDIQWID